MEFEGAVYHVMCRGNRREAIFRVDADRELFLGTVEEVCARTGWRMHALVLMGNHYHLLVETPEPNLVRGMHWFQTAYTARFNARHRMVGHLFAGRYKAIPVDPEDRSYFATVSDYIHLNPARAGLIGSGPLAAYPWSSLKRYALAGRKRPCWMDVATVPGEFGWRDGAADRRLYLARMEERAQEGRNAGDSGALKRGWILGGEDFRDRILEMLEGESSASSREYRRDHGERRAESLLFGGLGLAGLDESDLAELPKGDWRKRVIGHVLKRETSVRLAWLGERLRMGSPSYASRKCSCLSDLENSAEVLALLKRLGSLTCE